MLRTMRTAITDTKRVSSLAQTLTNCIHMLNRHHTQGWILANYIKQASIASDKTFYFEIFHPDTQELLTIAEAYWPEGLQPGMGEPVLLELDKRDVDEEKMDDLDMKVFYSIRRLKRYVAAQAKISSGENSA